MVEIKIQKSVLINLPAVDIFAYICDLENMVDWAGTVISMRKTSSGDLGTGATVNITFHFLGKWLSVLFEIVEYSPGRILAFKSIAGSPLCLFCYQFEEVEGGGTITSQEAILQIVDGIMDQSSSVITSAVDRQIEYDLQTLKEVVEARVASS